MMLLLKVNDGFLLIYFTLVTYILPNIQLIFKWVYKFLNCFVAKMSILTYLCGPYGTYIYESQLNPLHFQGINWQEDNTILVLSGIKVHGKYFHVKYFQSDTYQDERRFFF